MYKYIISFLLLANISYSQSRTFFIGDYGENTAAELAVRNTMYSMFQGGYDTVITLGDNNYPLGSSQTIMENIGKYYSTLMYPFNNAGFSNPNLYRGNPNRTNYLMPCMGNHDWYLNPVYGYTLFFNNIPNFYKFTQGDIEFFIYDSYIGDDQRTDIRREPAGVGLGSAQQIWLESALRSSVAKWQVVILHHPPYCSTLDSRIVQFPYRQWGADLVMAGHDHLYERLYIDSLYYTINGLGGGAKDPYLPVPRNGSLRLYNQYYGFQLMLGYPDSLVVSFINVGGTVVDKFTVGRLNQPNPQDSLRTLSDSVKVLWKREFGD